MERQKLCIVTDAWLPQVNGVVTTLTNLVKQAESNGWEVLVIHPGMFPGIPAPRYSEVKLCFTFGIKKMIRDFDPDHLHIATEGPLGISARISYRRRQYTTAYHTQWAMFLKDIMNIPESLTWKYVSWFHENGKVMVPTPSIRDELSSKNIRAEIVLFSRGVDLGHLKATVKHKKNKKPRLLSVGRVSREKNLDAFCSLDSNLYDLVVVGDGPYLAELKTRYPHVEFKGMLRGTDLANEYKLADCMVFTSVKDTFGLVIIESQCQGTPVAAFPVKGPIDVILPETGAMDKDISTAINAALKLDRNTCRDVAMKRYSWQRAWEDFKGNLVSHEDSN